MRVAAIQPRGDQDDPRAQLDAAEHWVKVAARRGAELVLCPEFLATGYLFEPRIWERAEPAHGRTRQWLGRVAKEQSCWLGATFLEADGESFWNTFVLVGPDGEERGRVRKARPPFFESWWYDGADDSHVIETEIGRVGVGICFESQRRALWNEWQRDPPDLILMPHSYPFPTHLFGVRGAMQRSLGRVARAYARALGVPVLLANKTGVVRTRLPIAPFIPLRLTFAGGTAVATAHGTESLEPGDQGLVVRDVTLGVSTRTRERRPGLGPAMAGLEWLLSSCGRGHYALSRRRRRAARTAVISP